MESRHLRRLQRVEAGVPRTIPVVLAILILLASGAAALAGADEAAEDEARKVFMGAFREGLQPEERVKALEQVCRDHGESRWADDALWVLAQAADADGDARRAIMLRRQLLDRDEPPALESYTETLHVYERSRLPGVIYLLERTGQRYSHDEMRVVPFNPAPMVTSEELAMGYERIGRYELALDQYRRAAAAAPPDGLFARLYAQRVAEVEKKAELLRKQKEAGGGQAPDDAAPQQDETPEDAAESPAQPAGAEAAGPADDDRDAEEEGDGE